MFSKIIRIVVSAAIFGWSLYSFIDGEIGNGVALLFPAAIVLFTYFRNERILISLYHMRKQDLEKAEKAGPPVLTWLHSTRRTIFWRVWVSM